MRFPLVLLLGAAPGLSRPSDGPRQLVKRFDPEPRASRLDWNAARPDGDFLAARAGLHTEAYFNEAASRRSRTDRDASPAADPGAGIEIESRATSGRWESLSGTTHKKYHPAPVSWGGRRLDLFYTSEAKTCHYKSRLDSAYSSQWSPWEDLGGEIEYSPAACSRKKENMHLFCTGTDGQAWHRSYSSSWGKWQAMGGKVKHEPAACSWGADHAAVYVSASDGQCWGREYSESAGGWRDWKKLGGYLAGPPRVVSWGPGHQSVYCRGEDGQAWHRKMDPSSKSWGEWETLGGSLDSAPAACAWRSGQGDRMDMYVKGSDGACWHKTYQNETVAAYDETTGRTTPTTLPAWGAWENLGGSMKPGTAPDVAVVGGGMEVYITGDDDAVYRKKWRDGSWTQEWEPMGGSVETQPAAVAWGDGDVDVYFTGKDGAVKRCY